MENEWTPQGRYIISKDGIWRPMDSKNPDWYCSQIPAINCLLYGHLISLERELRKLILYVLKSMYGSQWKSPIPGIVKGRMDEEKKFRHIVSSSSISIVSFLEISEGEDIITSKDIWKDFFKEHFPSLEMSKDCFKKLKAIRHKIAHSRPCSRTDERVFLENIRVISSSLQSFINSQRWHKITNQSSWYSIYDEASHFENSMISKIVENSWNIKAIFDLTIKGKCSFDLLQLLEFLNPNQNYFTFLEVPTCNVRSTSIVVSKRIEAGLAKTFLDNFISKLNEIWASKESIIVNGSCWMPEDLPEYCLWEFDRFITFEETEIPF